MNLVLNNLQRLICHKIQTTNQPTNLEPTSYIYKISNTFVLLEKKQCSEANETYLLGCPRGVMVKAMNCRIVVREFVLQSRYYVHFRANTLGKGMNPLILPQAMGK